MFLFNWKIKTNCSPVKTRYNNVHNKYTILQEESKKNLLYTTIASQLKIVPQSVNNPRAKLENPKPLTKNEFHAGFVNNIILYRQIKPHGIQTAFFCTRIHKAWHWISSLDLTGVLYCGSVEDKFEESKLCIKTLSDPSNMGAEVLIPITSSLYV